MSNRKLTKFPVIAEDGTEYRVTITEHAYFRKRWAEVCFYLPRKYIGWRKVAECEVSSAWAYDPDYPDYADTARKAFVICDASSHKRKSAAIDAFQAWDGRL